MRAAVLDAPRELSIQEVDEPRAAADEVLIEVRASGICGSDLHVYRGDHPFRFPPVVLGHEVAGTVIEVGNAVRDLQVGDRVAVEPHVYCGRCAQCARGLHNLCADKRVPGVGWEGTFSDRIAAPERVCHVLADDVSFADGAMFEPLAVAVRAARTSGIGFGDRVAVLGAGTIGSLVARVCQHAGVADLLVTDVKPFNLDFIRSLGPCTAVDVRETDAVDVADAFDAVVCTSGVEGSLKEAVQLVRPGGTVVVVSLFKDDVPLDANRLVTAEVVLRGTLTYTSDDFRRTAALVNGGQFDVGPFITERLTLDEAPEVFRSLDEGRDCIKATIEFGG